MRTAHTGTRRRRTTGLLAASALLLAAACGDNDDNSTADTTATQATPAATQPADDTDDAPADTTPDDERGEEAPVDTEAPAATDPPAEPEEPDRLVTNFYEVDGVQYATRIDMCFGAPGQDLEALSVVNETGGRANAYVVTADDGTPVLSNFSVEDRDNGNSFIANGDDATDIVFEGGRIAASTVATTDAGAEIRTSFDFTCPGR